MCCQVGTRASPPPVKHPKTGQFPPTYCPLACFPYLRWCRVSATSPDIETTSFLDFDHPLRFHRIEGLHAFYLLTNSTDTPTVSHFDGLAYGYRGVDTVIGADGNDWISGRRGDDCITLDGADVTVYGGDTISTGGGNNTADGGPVDITTTILTCDVIITAAGNADAIVPEDAAAGSTGGVFVFQ